MNNVLPGFIDSLQHSETVLTRIPMGRIGTVDEITKTTAFLLSDDAGYMTGQNLQVNGGLTLRRNPTSMEIEKSVTAAMEAQG